MFRKLIVAIVGVAAMAIMASPSPAAQVDDPGMYYLTGGTLAMVFHVPGVGEVARAQCDLELEANVSANGHVDIHNVEYDGGGDCGSINDCDDNGWEGQITSEHSVHINLCIDIFIYVTPTFAIYQEIPGEITCSISANSAFVDCENSVLTTDEITPDTEFNGSLLISDDFGPTPIEIER